MNRRKELYPLSILRKLTGFYQKSTNDTTKWGLENESKVIIKYETLFNKKFSTCDLIVNTKRSFPRCNSDGNVQGQKDIEIKCHSKFKHLDINVCCHDNFFFKTLKNNKLTLTLNHQYHIQCQDIMVITKLKILDFVKNIQTITF